MLEVMWGSERADTQEAMSHTVSHAPSPARDNGFSETSPSGVLCRNALPFLKGVKRHVWGTSWRKGQWS